MRKKFLNGLYYSGEVTSISQEEIGERKTLYHIQYDDGDEEDLYDEELRPLLTTSAAGKH